MIYSFLTIFLLIFFPACGAKTDLEWDLITETEGEGAEPKALCPTENIYTSPERPVLIQGGSVDNGEQVVYAWTVTESPVGSTAVPIPSDSKVTTFEPDIAGPAGSPAVYVLTLTVSDARGRSDSCSVTIFSVMGPPVALCAGDMTVLSGSVTLLEGGGYDDGVIEFYLWEIIDAPAVHASALLNPHDALASFVAGSEDRGLFLLQLTVVDDAGLQGYCTVEVTVVRTPPTAVCPPGIVTPALSQVELAGNSHDGGPNPGYTWELASMPAASSAEPPEPPGERVTWFTPDVIGAYSLVLTVMGEGELTSSCEVSVSAVSGDGLHVELFWNPPESAADNSNACLHLLHPDAPYWFHYILDCYKDNCGPGQEPPDWDNPGDDDDPRLDLIESLGFGPENINLSVPVTGHIYTVGVHYYQGMGMDEAEVFVKIYCGVSSDMPAYEAGPVIMRDYGGSPDGNDFWKVAALTWEGEGCSVTPIDEMVLALAAMYER
jgi:hypothetical protein